jgi:hypothetical protein
MSNPVAWAGQPPHPIFAKNRRTFHRLDLTGDRPLSKKDARLLAKWWGSQPQFSYVLEKSGRFWRVFADKVVYEH